jgi:stearoyl-CoA desaturase (delta-9 desaturase)
LAVTPYPMVGICLPVNPTVEVHPAPNLRVSWSKTVPFLLMHLACLSVLWVGVSKIAVGVCLINYWLRMFGITAGYHRYFSHRSYKTSRAFQFALAWIGASSAQLGPLWWAAHHRQHHQYADTERDVHPPGLRGFLWSHMGWIFCDEYAVTHYNRVKDFARFPEIQWLERNWLLPPAVFGAAMLGMGSWLGAVHPELGTNGFQLLAWGFFVSTIVVYHATFCINSLAHMVGDRAYANKDDSRNNLALALLTLGEGWHNNHHKFPTSERQGIHWYEIDPTHYVLVMLSWVGLVWDLRTPPRGAELP